MKGVCMVHIGRMIEETLCEVEENEEEEEDTIVVDPEEETIVVDVEAFDREVTEALEKMS